MELKEAIIKRRSVRDFLGRDIEDSIIMDILEYANLAPSAGNLQARDFIVVRDRETRERLMVSALDQEFVSEAPVDIVVCANLKRISPYGERGRNLYCIQDASASIEHILLLAQEYGLATCWVGAFDERDVSEILNLPRWVRPVAIIPIGYPKHIPKPTPRKRIEELVHFDRW